jgi:WD40 repeat protein
VDVESGETLYNLTGHVGTLKQVQWDPINSRALCSKAKKRLTFQAEVLASGGRDGTVRLWDLRMRPAEGDEDEDRKLLIDEESKQYQLWQ